MANYFYKDLFVVCVIFCYEFPNHCRYLTHFCFSRYLRIFFHRQIPNLYLTRPCQTIDLHRCWYCCYWRLHCRLPVEPSYQNNLLPPRLTPESFWLWFCCLRPFSVECRSHLNLPNPNQSRCLKQPAFSWRCFWSRWVKFHPRRPPGNLQFAKKNKKKVWRSVCFLATCVTPFTCLR